MELMNTNWNFPTTIWFGVGRINDLPLSCQKTGIKKPLLVTDNGLVKLDIFEKAKRILKKAGIDFTTYNDVQGNPTEANVLNGVTHYNENGHDGVIAFGGGSALDAAKAIAFMSGQSRSLWDFEDVGDNWSRASPAGIAPIIALPTTAGTGSEVGRASVILDEKLQLKKIIFHPNMLPRLVILDPELTLGLPPHITAWTGVDAMVHALEAYCAPGYHPMADGIAIEAIRIVARYLPTAFSKGSDIEARGQMLVAAAMGATAFQKGLGSVHSIAHQLGAIYNKEHGLLNAILLPYALKQNSSVIEKKMGYLSKVLDLQRQGTDGVLDYILQLRKDLGIPHTLREIGINEDEAQRIGKMASLDPSTPTNARPLKSEDLEHLFRAAVTGEINSL